MPLPDVPDEYEGSVSDFVDRYVVPAFPSAGALLAWTEALLEYYARPRPVYLVRGRRKGELVERAGQRIVETDNAPGIWCYLRAVDGEFRADRLADALEAGDVPVLAMLQGAGTRDWDWNYSRRALPPQDKNALWDRRLKHCHILAVAERDAADLRQRSLRNLSPMNHFVFPNGNKHFSTVRIGWTEVPAALDLGESPRVLAWVALRLREFVGSEGSRTFDRFRSAAGAGPVARPPDGRIRITRKVGVPTTIRPLRDPTPKPADSAARRPTSATAGSIAARPDRSKGGTIRNWTMNSNLDYYVKTGETAQVVSLSLSYRRPDGRIEAVGAYVLDLLALAQRGLCTQRGSVYDLKVTRSGGRFYLGVRTAPRAPLDEFRA